MKRDGKLRRAAEPRQGRGKRARAIEDVAEAAVSESGAITLKEGAEYLKCHPWTLYRLAKLGKLPVFRLGGEWRFLRSDLEAWIERQHGESGRQAK